MDLKQMYKGMPFSPISTLTANISATDTIIPVSDVNAFPEAPSIAVIGPDIGPNETIIYTGKTTTALTGCTRGVESTASAWDIDEIIARNFTAKDHNDIIDNINDLASNKLDATYKVDVVNDSTITASGKALDARQNNPNVDGTLAKKIAENANKINNCLKKVVVMPAGTHVNQCYETGIYKCVSWKGYPAGAADGQGTLLVINYAGDCITGWVEQEFITPHRNISWKRTYAGGMCTEWSKIATIRNIQVNYLNGWVPDTTGGWTNDVYIIGDVLFFNLCVANPSGAAAWTVVAEFVINEVFVQNSMHSVTASIGNNYLGGMYTMAGNRAIATAYPFNANVLYYVEGFARLA